MSLNELIDKVEGLEDFREAEQALLSLKKIDPQKAKDLSLSILAERKGDIFFQSGAFEVLYSVDRASALSYVEENISSVELDLLNTIMESVTEDSGLVKEEPRLLEVAKCIHRRLSEVSDNEIEEIEESVNWFKGSFQL